MTRRQVLLRDIDHLRSVMGVPFSDDQADAIVAPMDTPTLIVAGAGSGKTAVMAARVVWLVGRGQVDPDQILGLTFTKKAAAEFGSRVRASLELLAADASIDGYFDDSGEPTVSTYHAYSGDIIAEHGLRLGFENDLRVTSDASRFQRVARIVGQHRGSLSHVSDFLPTTVSDVMSLDAELSEHLVTTDQLREFDHALRGELDESTAPQAIHRKGRDASLRRTELSDLVDEYREAKQCDGVMDFSDQMAWGAQLAITCPEVGASQRERFAVVLLDEYQDTSAAQRQLLQAVFSGPTETSGRGHPITAVGDPAQSIYGWRGAAANNLADFLDHFPDRGGQRGRQHSLVVSRRCGSDILDLANTLAEPFFASGSIVQPLRPADDHQGCVQVACFSNVAEEIDWIASQVAEAHRTGTDWNEIAILVRTRAEIGQLAHTLRRSDVPVEVVGLGGLLIQPEVADIVATLNVVHSVTANPSLLRLLMGARWRIGARDLALLGKRARELSAGFADAGEVGGLDDDLLAAVSGTDPTEILSLADAIEDPGDYPYSPQALTRFAALSEQLTMLRRHVDDSLPDLVRRVVKTLDLDIELGAQRFGGSALDNIRLLLEAVADFTTHAEYASLPGLVAYLQAESDYNDDMALAAPSPSDSVKLMTIHRSKGLEWDKVFVPCICEGVFPSHRGRPRWVTSGSALPAPLRGDADAQPRLEEWSNKAEGAFKDEHAAQAVAEELRLAYVAFTRARDSLVLTGHWWGRTQKKPRGPSAFLKQAQEWVQSRGNPVDVWAPQPAGDENNPFVSLQSRAPWPSSRPVEPTLAAAAQAVHDYLDDQEIGLPDASGSEVETMQLAALDALDGDIALLIAEADRLHNDDEVVVRLPAEMSTTQLMRLANDPAGLARDLVRPMPRRPSPAARFGTRFHAWVEARFGQQALLDSTDLPGRGDEGIADEEDMVALRRIFENGSFGDRTPYALEVPFSLHLAGRQIRGRIDAVYETGDGFEVVDWKTNKNVNADGLQLAVYRLAWAQLQGVDPADVCASFYYVRLNKSVRYDDLPGHEQLAQMILAADR